MSRPNLSYSEVCERKSHLSVYNIKKIGNLALELIIPQVYKHLLKPLLFTWKPERAHHFTFSLMSSCFNLPGIKGIVRGLFSFEDDTLKRTVFGLTFKNPVGLAAGLDKDAKLIDELSLLGFGFIEIGTLTPKPQDGNPQPRLFRLPGDKALLNRMGFNNGGVEEAVKRLKKRKSQVLIGGNIGKNKTTANEDAINDYLFCLEVLHPYVDYFVVNVSSPNTPNLRELQEKEPLKKLLLAVRAENDKKRKPKPILLKIAPDLTNGQLDDIIEIVEETKIDGVIATNTTIDRSVLIADKELALELGDGGISGVPLKSRSTEVIRYLSQKSGGSFPIIGVGGISSTEDAIEKLEAGASLVQVYSGMIYEGPGLIREIKKGLVQHYKS